jgi:hypothetical protein
MASKMYNSGILLFPDTGPQFMRALRTAALYSGEVHSLTVVDGEVARAMLDAFGPARSDNQQSESIAEKRLRAYFNFIVSEESTLSLAADTGVLKPILRGGLDEVNAVRMEYTDRFLSRILDIRPKKKRIGTIKMVDQVSDLLGCDTPPTYGDLSWIGLALRVVNGREDGSMLLKNQEVVSKLLLCQYLVTVSAVAEVRGVCPSTWDSRWLDAMWTLRSLHVTDGRPEVGGRRREAEANMGNLILERHIPAVDDLPLEAVLEIRRERSSEVEAFQVGVAALAAKVDVSAPFVEAEREMLDLIVRKVDPALHDLSAAVASSRDRTLAKLGRPAHYGASLVSASIAFAAGAPLNVSAAVAAAGALVGTAIEGAVERKNLRRASQWGLLYRLDQLHRK